MRTAGQSGETSQAEVPLFSRFPELRGRLPYVSLSRGPSPVSRLDRLAKAVGGGDIWLKNEGRFGTTYGGNKPRKLEFVLADALGKRAGALVTSGALGTNHGLAAALYGRELGLRVVLLLTYQQPGANVTRQLCRMQAAGAALHYTYSLPLSIALGPYYAFRHRADGPSYILAPGASTPLGTVGYVNAALELAEQVRAGELPEPATLLLPVGSGGTAAGIALGLALAGLRTQVLAVAITRAPAAWGIIVRGLAGSTGALLRRKGLRADVLPARALDLRVLREWLAPGYGRPSAAGEEAARLLLETEGLRADPTYTAKTAAALIALQRRGALRGPVLYWHTYDALSDDARDCGPAEWARLPAAVRRFCQPS